MSGDGKKKKGLLTSVFNAARRFAAWCRHGNLETALVHSAKMGHERRVAFLIASGINPRTRDNQAMILAAARGHTDVLEVLFKVGILPDENNNAALYAAIRKGQRDTVRFLATQGVDIRANDDEAIVVASGINNVRMMELLISLGADVEARGGTPLRIARENKLEYIELVILRTLSGIPGNGKPQGPKQP